MNDEQTRAKTNLDNLREDLIEHQNARAAHVAGIAHADAIIELRKADIARAEETLKWAKYPVYDRTQGVARRVSHVSKLYITLRWDLGRTQEYRRSDGRPKRSHNRGERIDDARAVALYNEYLTERHPNRHLTCP